MLINPTAGHPLLEPLRDSLRILLGVPCFIRRSRSGGALFAADALMRTDGPEDLANRLNQSGEWTAVRDGRLLQIDPSPALWRRLINEAPVCNEKRPEAYPAYPFLVSCALRLASEAVPAEIQPEGPLRRTLKRLEAGEYERLQDELPAEVAVLQRRRQPLPAAAGLYILSALKER